MRPHAEGFGNHGAALAALLAREVRGDVNYPVPGAFSLGFEDVHERAPRGIDDSAGEAVVTHHSFHVQVFDFDDVDLLEGR